MSEFAPSAALLRTRLVSRSAREGDQLYERGLGTKPATQAHLRQAASIAVDRAVQQAARRRPTSEERQKAIARRRRWGGGSDMPPHLRDLYTEGERAALAVIAMQCRKHGFCALCLDEIASLSGVSRTTVQNAIRKARSNERAHLSVRERPQQGGKSLTNVIKIICRSWLGWIGRAIGFKRLSPSETGSKISLSKGVETAKMAFERECVAAARAPNRASAKVENPSHRRTASSRWLHSSAARLC
nr:helix-turn-helix domain-containing protein [Rhizobium sp. Q54]